MPYGDKSSFIRRSLRKGSVVSWETAKFELTNMTAREVEIDTICKPVKPGHVLIPNLRQFESLVGVCKKLHGATSAITSRDLQATMTELILKTPSCSTPWSGECVVFIFLPCLIQVR